MSDPDNHEDHDPYSIPYVHEGDTNHVAVHNRLRDALIALESRVRNIAHWCGMSSGTGDGQDDDPRQRPEYPDQPPWQRHPELPEQPPSGR